MMDIIW